MLGLRRADDVHHPIDIQPFDTIDDAGKIGGGVVVATDRVLDDQRQRLAVTIRVTGGKDDLRAVALLHQAGLAQALDDDGQHRVVHALRGEVVVGEQHAELVIHLVEVAGALGDEYPPQPQGLRIAPLQFHDALTSTVLEHIVGVELRPCPLVEAGEVTDRQFARRGRLTEIEHVLDEHPERRAPITDVILLRHPMTEELQHPHERVTDDGGAQMADVHFLGNVRMRIVDDDMFDARRWAYSEVLVSGSDGELAGEKFVRERQIEKTRAGDIDGTAHAKKCRPGCGKNLLCHFTRVLAESLGDRQGAVGLGIGTVARAHDRLSPRSADGGERGCEQFCDGDKRIGHGAHIVPDRLAETGVVSPCRAANVHSRLSCPRSSGDRALVSGTMCGSSNLSEGARQYRP